MRFAMHYRCPACGSTEIGAPASVYWDESRGYWSLPACWDPVDKCWCRNCDVEFSIEEAEESAEKARNQNE